MRNYINIINENMQDINGIDVQEFIQGYIDAILFAECDGDDCPLDKKYSPEDFSKEMEDRINSDCRSFLHAASPYLTLDGAYAKPLRGGTLSAHAGHDFWLTRAHHGAGFWDGDWSSEVSDILTEKAGAMGGLDVYVGDDNLLYFG